MKWNDGDATVYQCRMKPLKTVHETWPCVFSVAGPEAWNTLPNHFRDLVLCCKLRSSQTVCTWSVSRHTRERHPFPQESVGGWRKDEFQWMSLALVGDRKNIRPQNFCTSHRLYFPSTPLPSPFVWEGHGRMDGVKPDEWRRESQVGNQLTTGSCGRNHRFIWKNGCVCVFEWMSLLH